MTHDSILKDLKAGKVYPVYYLCGEEPHFIDLITDYMEEHLLQPHEKAFNQVVLYGRDTNMKQILDEAFKVPMMGGRQLVLVKEAQNLKDKEMDELLTPYLDKPVKSSILVFAVKGKKLDKRKNITKKLMSSCVVLETLKLKDSQVPGWIEQQVKQMGFNADQTTIQMLSDYLGTDISVIHNELSKLALNLSKGSLITPEVIEQNIGISREYNVFELQKVIGERNISKVMRITLQMSSNIKDYPMELTLSSLYNYFSALYIMHYSSQVTDADLRKEHNWWPDLIQQYRKACSKYSVRNVEDILLYISEYDGYIKGLGNASTERGDLMKELICKIVYI